MKEKYNNDLYEIYSQIERQIRYHQKAVSCHSCTLFVSSNLLHIISYRYSERCQTFPVVLIRYCILLKQPISHFSYAISSRNCFYIATSKPSRYVQINFRLGTMMLHSISFLVTHYLLDFCNLYISNSVFFFVTCVWS